MGRKYDRICSQICTLHTISKDYKWKFSERYHFWGLCKKEKTCIQMTTLLKTKHSEAERLKASHTHFGYWRLCPKTPCCHCTISHNYIFENQCFCLKISAWWFTSVRGWGLNVSVVTAELGLISISLAVGHTGNETKRRRRNIRTGVIGGGEKGRERNRVEISSKK